MNTSAYTGRQTNWTAVVVSILLLIPLAGLAATSSGPVPKTALVVAAVALLGIVAEVVTAGDVRATCGPQGVSIHWGAFGWPRAKYSLADIKEASVIRVPWWAVSYGFWWTPTRTVCTVRTGPALRLLLHSGRKVTITVPDARAAVDTLRRATTSV